MAEQQNLVLELAYTAHVRVNLLVTSPSELPQSTPNPVPALVSSELTTPPDTQSDITPAPESSPLPGGSVSDITDAPISEAAFSSGPRQSSRPTRRPSYLKVYVT